MAAAIVAGVGAAANIGMSIWGANKASAAADRAEEAQIRAIKAQYQYDLDRWDANKKALQAQRQEQVDQIFLNARNQGKERAYQDVANLDKYYYNLQIRDRQQRGNEAAFSRSEDVYQQTTNLNSIQGKSAMDASIKKLEEQKDELAFDRQESYIEMLQTEGRLRAKGITGRSGAKARQAQFADYGRQVTALNATDDSMGSETRRMLEEILRDKYSADLTAYASKMLDPGVLPEPVRPDPLPAPEIFIPRVFSDFDFGPQPIEGAMPASGVAHDMIWGQALGNIGSSIGSFASAYAANMGSGSSFSGGDYSDFSGSMTGNPFAGGQNVPSFGDSIEMGSLF
tara:strand:+ start:826 stop:1848 length:1023 start_codon:yes stop_codon:yes gene_type:complete